MGIVISESTWRLSSLMPCSAEPSRFAAFHVERLGHDRHGEDAKLLRDLGHHGRGTGARPTAHTGGDEQHVRAFDHFDDAIAIFHRRLTADFRIRARAQALGDIAADLQTDFHLRMLQRLSIRIEADEIDAFDPGRDHVRHGVAAATAHANDLDHGTLVLCICKYKHR